MSYSIRIPDSAYHTQTVNLGNSAYRINFKYNTSDTSWYFSLETLSGGLLLGDTKIMPNQNLTGRFPTYNPLPNGNIWCLRFKNDFTPITRDNLGINKNYELVYITFEEELELGINDTIQL